MVKYFQFAKSYSRGILKEVGINVALQDKLIYTLLILLVLWIIQQVVLFLVVRTSRANISGRYYRKKTIAYIIYALGTLALSWIWIDRFESVATFFGLITAGLAIAFKDLIMSIVGWVYIVWRKPFKVGDRIEINDVAGDVVDISLFRFVLMEIGNWVDAEQSTGRILHVPNAKIINSVLANYTDEFEYIWNEIPICVTFESDWKKAKQILTQIAYDNYDKYGQVATEKIKNTSSKYLIVYRKTTPIVYTSLADQGVTLTLRYLCPVRGRRGSMQEIMENILNTFEHEKIHFAYPTQRFYTSESDGRSC